MKKIIYISSWIVLGVLLSFIVHALIEKVYIEQSLARGVVLENQQFLGKAYCVLPQYLSAGLLALGIVGGFFAGRFFWRVIYVEDQTAPYCQVVMNPKLEKLRKKFQSLIKQK